MAQVTGRVVAGQRPIRGLLIEVFDVGRAFSKHIPVSHRKNLVNHGLKRLGSSISNGSGEFLIEFDHDKKRARFFSSNSRNLWLTASACCGNSDDNQFIYQASDIRACAAQHEEYVICLSEDYEDVNNTLSPVDDRPTAALVADNHAYTKEIVEARRAISREKVAEKESIRKEFREKIAPEFIGRLSNVERDDKGIAVDEFFVEQGAPVRKAAETKIAERMSTDLDTSVKRKDRFSLKGRISLTPEQVAALKAKKVAGESDADGFAVTEKTLNDTLKDEPGSGANPEADTQIVNRVDSIKQICREKTNGEKCLYGEDGHGSHNNGDNPEPSGGDHSSDEDDTQPVVNGGGTANGDGENRNNGDRLGDRVALQALKDDIPTYIASVLDESSVLDGGNSQLPAPGSRLDENGILAADSFPSLTLPPGPADVPAFYDFYDLQIAFSPVWQEALDEGIVGDIEALYERYVEGGGTSDNFVYTIVGYTANIASYLFGSQIDVSVQRHVEIDTKEWDALNSDQQTALSTIATEIDTRLTFLYQRKLQDKEYDDGVTESDLKVFNQTKQYIMSRVEELRTQAQRIVSSAKKELERQAAGRSIVPNNGILQQLRNRLLSAYPAKYFAANKTQRSVNFGLMLTYRQQWTPTAYQVGELIKSIPLAPKEIRKYSKKTVRKRRRSKKEIENNIESLKSDTSSTTRAEAEIVQDATDKTNFNASANGSFSVGVWSGGGSSSLTQDTASRSAETKKRMHEAVVKSAREYKNEIKVELTTEESFEEEFQESGEMINPNDELTVTYLFYELQRRYRVEEKLHRMMSVVLVAQEMPNPADIDEDWLIAHRWILNRVLLDDAFKQPLYYVAEGIVAEQFALEESRKSLEQQRRIVEELKEDVSDARITTESRYDALQRSMERSARATQRKSKGGGLFGFTKKLTSIGVVGDLVDRFVGGEDETPEAARVREAAAQDAYQRE